MNPKETVLQQLGWYDRAARRNQLLFYGAKTLQVGAAAVVPILALTRAEPLVTAAVGALVAVLVGLEEVFRFHEKWLNYRSSCETLRMEVFLHQAGAGAYAAAALDSERDRLLAERFASVATQELERWHAMAAQAGNEVNAGRE